MQADDKALECLAVPHLAAAHLVCERPDFLHGWELEKVMGMTPYSRTNVSSMSGGCVRNSRTQLLISCK